MISTSRVPSDTSILKTLYSEVVSVSSKVAISPSVKTKKPSSAPSDTESKKFLSRVILRDPEEGASTKTVKDLKSRSTSNPNTVISVTS